MQRPASTDSLLPRATTESGDAGDETHDLSLQDAGIAARSSAAVGPPHAVACRTPHAVACWSQDHEAEGHIGVYQDNWGGHQENPWLIDPKATYPEGHRWCKSRPLLQPLLQELHQLIVTLIADLGCGGGVDGLGWDALGLENIRHKVQSLFLEGDNWIEYDKRAAQMYDALHEVVAAHLWMHEALHEVVADAATEQNFKHMIQTATDVVVVAISRGLSLEKLQVKGTIILHASLESAFGRPMHAHANHWMYARFGHSKYMLFTPGIRWLKPRGRGRGLRRGLRLQHLLDQKQSNEPTCSMMEQEMAAVAASGDAERKHPLSVAQELDID